MTGSWILDGVRTPFGRVGKSLAGVRPDDLAAVVLRKLVARHTQLDPGEIDEVILGDANAAGEDNRNVARMATILAGLPVSVPGVTVNRLRGSGFESVIQASRMIETGDANLVIAGGGIDEPGAMDPAQARKGLPNVTRNALLLDSWLEDGQSGHAEGMGNSTR